MFPLLQTPQKPNFGAISLAPSAVLKKAAAKKKEDERQKQLALLAQQIKGNLAPQPQQPTFQINSQMNNPAQAHALIQTGLGALGSAAEAPARLLSEGLQHIPAFSFPLGNYKVNFNPQGARDFSAQPLGSIPQKVTTEGFKQAGLPSKVATPLAFAATAIGDPTNAFGGEAKAAKNIGIVRKIATDVLNAIKQGAAPEHIASMLSDLTKFKFPTEATQSRVDRIARFQTSLKPSEYPRLQGYLDDLTNHLGANQPPKELEALAQEAKKMGEAEFVSHNIFSKSLDGLTWKSLKQFGGKEGADQLANFYRTVVKPQSVPKELEPLAAEARKYKSAEEFLKAPDFSHGGALPLERADSEALKVEKTDPRQAQLAELQAKLDAGYKTLEAKFAKMKDQGLRTPERARLVDEFRANIEEPYTKLRGQVRQDAFDKAKTQLTDFYNQVKGISGGIEQNKALLPQEGRTPLSPLRESVSPPQPPVPPPSSSLAGNIPPSNDPVKGLLESLRQAKIESRPALEKMYAEELTKRAGAVRGVREQQTGSSALYGSLSKLKGELAPKKPSFTPPTINPDEAQKIHDLLRTSNLGEFEYVTAGKALDNILQGVIPTHNEIRLIEKGLGYKGEIQQALNKLQTASIPQKIATAQTIAQLLNPKTLIRNLGGNTMFAGLENAKQVVATPIDKLVSLFTGKRTTGLPSLSTQASGLKKGFLQGVREAKMGVNIGPQTQFELPQVQVFKDKVLGSLEKAMGMALRAPDKAAYTAAFDDSVRTQMKANKTTTATQEMLDAAHYDGLYRTFQDENFASRFFEGVKNLLNMAGVKGADGKTFGLGDIVLKYPKTPGALLARGVDYSPAGFIKTLFQMGKPLFGKPFNQKAFVDSFSRALVGSTSLVGVGAYMRKLGIITGAPADDTDVRAVQKSTGQGAYQINVSALKRFIMTGFNTDAAKQQDGDTLVTYDWAQPMAAPLSLGAKIADGKASDAQSAIAESIVGGVDTLQEQPLVSGLKRLLGYGDIKGGAVATAEGIPASFVPTLARQANQVGDNTIRSTYDPSKVQEGLNMVKAKIPGLAQTLPVSPDPFGQNREAYQGGTNNLFNIFLNPAFVTHIKESPEAKMVLDLMEKTGETKQMPRVVAKNQTVNGQQIALTAKQYVDLQKYVGEKTKEQFQALAQSDAFNKLSDEEKVKQLTSVLTDIGKLGKIVVLGDGGDAQKIQLSLDVKNNPDVQSKSKSIYDRVQSFNPSKGWTKAERARATAYVNSLSEEDYKAYQVYKTFQTSTKASNTTQVRQLLSSNPKEAVAYVRSLDPKEAQRIINLLSDAEYKLYQSGK